MKKELHYEYDLITIILKIKPVNYFPNKKNPILSNP